jgi:hypothetical protein
MHPEMPACTMAAQRAGHQPAERLIEAMAGTFGVRPAFFFGDHDDSQAGLIQEEVEMLAMIRDASITTDQLRPFLRLSPEARQLFIDFVTVVARDEARRRARRLPPGGPGLPDPTRGSAARRRGQRHPRRYRAVGSVVPEGVAKDSGSAAVRPVCSAAAAPAADACDEMGPGNRSLGR